MKKLLAFLNNMDARAWRTVWVSLALLAGVGALTLLGKSMPGVSENVEQWLEGLRGSVWALPATVVIFVVAAFVIPVIMLAGACIFAFGPWIGFAYAMIGTIVSSGLQFYIGRWGGTKLVQRYGGDIGARMSHFIGRNDFWASAIVRSVPTGPALVVNMAFGASHANFWRFIAGGAVGSVPKTLMVALFGQSMIRLLGGGVVTGVLLAALVVGAWITIALAARKAVRGEGEDAAASGDGKAAEPVAKEGVNGGGPERAAGNAEPGQGVGRTAGRGGDHDAGAAPPGGSD